MQKICTNCHYVGKGKAPGSFLIEVVLWLSFIVPGLIYSIWRFGQKKRICPLCGSSSMIPVDTPKGQELISTNKKESTQVAPAQTNESPTQPDFQQADWSARLKLGATRLLQYTIFIIFLMVGFIIAFGNFISGIIFIAAGSLILPQVQERLTKTPLKNSVALGVTMFLLVMLSGYFLISENHESSAPAAQVSPQQAKIAQVATQQVNLREEIEGAFSENPEKVLQEISTYAENKNWWMVKTKTEILLGTENSEIKKYYELATEEIKRQEEEQKKQDEERQKREEERRKLEEKQKLIDSWHVSRSSSKMDDTPSFSVSKDAQNSVQAWLKRVTPTLVLRCRENKTDVIFNADTNFNPVYGEYNKASIRYRLDDKKAQSQYWSESTDGDAVFAPQAISLLKSMRGAETLKIEFIPFNENPATVEFDLRGLEPHLNEIAKTCGWSF